MKNMCAERRNFLKLLLSAGPQTSVGLASLAAMSNIAAQTSSDTKFLVCLYMRGGNDQSNFLVPTTSSAYNAYASARAGISLSTSQVLPLSPNNYSGPALGMHPDMPFLQTLFNSGGAALIANVGNLVGPITKTQWNAGQAQTTVPAQLFSHNDQESQWASLSPLAQGKTGWLGRTADLISDSFNSSSPVSMNIALGRKSFILGGSSIFPYQITETGGVPLLAPRYSNTAATTLNNFYLQTQNNLLERQISSVFKRSTDAYTSLNTAISSVTVSNTFPSTPLGRQLNGVAKVMGGAANLGKRRMVFYVDIEGFDFHDDLVNRQAKCLKEVNDAIAAFHTYLTNSGNLAKTVVFAASDFGRALQTNGKGSDHGWGSHYFAFGGPVIGKKIYGQFPTVALNGPEDAGQGRLIPTTSFDEYATTLATWMGVSTTNLPLVAPNIGNFNNPNLGFLRA